MLDHGKGAILLDTIQNNTGHSYRELLEVTKDKRENLSMQHEKYKYS